MNIRGIHFTDTRPNRTTRTLDVQASFSSELSDADSEPSAQMTPMTPGRKQKRLST